MQARTKSPKHEGQNTQGEDQGWKRKKSPVDASPLLGRYQKDGRRKFTETNYEENGRKMKKRRLKLRRPMPKIRNSGVLSATVTSKTGGTAELTVWQRNMLLQKMVNGCNIARLNTNTRVVEVGKKRPMWWTGCCQIGNWFPIKRRKILTNIMKVKHLLLLPVSGWGRISSSQRFFTTIPT